MKWERGKGGKREAQSAETGATYVYADDGGLRVSRIKGTWIHLGVCGDLAEAQWVAADHDALLATACLAEMQDRARALKATLDHARLRDLYREMVLDGTFKGVYRAYCVMRGRGFAPDALVEHMGTLALADRELLGAAFERFFQAGMRVK